MRGFTLIELLVVLAILGTIFTGVGHLLLRMTSVEDLLILVLVSLIIAVFVWIGLGRRGRGRPHGR